MHLAADIGGTKSLIALAEGGRIVYQRHYFNDGYASLPALLAAFLADAGSAGHEGAARNSCLAVAGPVAGSRARLTNRPWEADAEALAAALPLGEVLLVNDFVATAAGLPTLEVKDLRPLQAGDFDAAAPRLVLGPGTGLGVAAWLPGGRVVASEGGHVGFAPADEEQRELLRFLAPHGERVSAERIVSGPGLAECHRYCSGGARLDPAEITRCAFAGDMAMAFIARGGVHLAGGIVPKVLPRLGSGGFLAAFNAKAEHTGLAAAMPVSAVLCDDLPLRGALEIVRRV